MLETGSPMFCGILLSVLIGKLRLITLNRLQLQILIDFLHNFRIILGEGNKALVNFPDPHISCFIISQQRPEFAAQQEQSDYVKEDGEGGSNTHDRPEQAGIGTCVVDKCADANHRQREYHAENSAGNLLRGGPFLKMVFQQTISPL